MLGRLEAPSVKLSTAVLEGSDDGAESWHEVSGNLPTDFGFPIDVHAHEPNTIYVVPIKSDSEHFVPDGKLRVYRSRSGGNEWEPLTKGLPQSDCYVNVLRDAMAVDSLDSCGVYFGTTGGQVFYTRDAGDSWHALAEHLPPLPGLRILKTDLWDEAKNTRILAWAAAQGSPTRAPFQPVAALERQRVRRERPPSDRPVEADQAGVPVRGVLEVVAGTAKRYGIAPGDRRDRCDQQAGQDHFDCELHHGAAL